MNENRTYQESDPFNGVISRTAIESVPAWPVPKAAPQGAPNILMIILDDLGFAQLGCFGGLGGRIQTPHLDKLATNGLRYTNMHSTALCSPSRSAILTGRNHHSNGVGIIMERATGFPGYNGRIPHECGMLPAVLLENGYNTFCLGKWHLAPDEHTGPTGPFDRWPLGQGFERFYGFTAGETDQWHPDLIEDNRRIELPKDNNYHLTQDLVDHAIEWISLQKAVNEEKPFYMYLSLGAVHSPHHAPKEYIERYKGIFDEGWDIIREQTLARQKELGVVPANTELPPVNLGLRAWYSLSDKEKAVYTRQMEVFAAFLTHTDEQLGRLLSFIEDSGHIDNTLILVVSDNGASAEGGPHGLITEVSYFNGAPETLDEMYEKLDDWGGPTTSPHYATGWAWAGNTPQRWYKGFTHEGGTRVPMIVHWPAGYQTKGEVRSQFHHLVDFTPTVLDLLGLEFPQVLRGYPQRPLEGASFAYTFADGNAPTRSTAQYFEIFGHRGLWYKGWKLVTMHPSNAAVGKIGDIPIELRNGDFDHDVWELYHLDEDFSEAHDVAAQHPERVEELLDMWWSFAGKYNVLPLDDRLIERLIAWRPPVFKEKDVYTYNARVRLGRSTSPNVINRSHNITARVEIPAGGAEGVIVSNGSLDGGYSLFVQDGRLKYVSNYLGREHFVIEADKPLPEGEVIVTMRWEKTGKFAGHVTLFQNKEKVGEGDVPRSNPVAYAATEGLEIGTDSVISTWPGYIAPFAFTGGIVKVVINTQGARYVDPEGEARRASLTQ